MTDISPLHPFSIHNIPFGVAKFSEAGSESKITVVSRIGDFGIDLEVAASYGTFDGTDFASCAVDVFARSSLNSFMALGRRCWIQARQSIQALVAKFQMLELDQVIASKIFISIDRIEMQLPIEIGDYTDFYASKEHATNVGTMFRGKENALMPNWFY